MFSRSSRVFKFILHIDHLQIVPAIASVAILCIAGVFTQGKVQTFRGSNTHIKERLVHVHKIVKSRGQFSVALRTQYSRSWQQHIREAKYRNSESSDV
jgi:hypothetical protein